MPYPRRPLIAALAFALVIAAGSFAVSGIPAPAFSLGWFSVGECDDATAANPGSKNPCRYDVAEENCADGVDNDSDEAADCADPDCEWDSNCDSTGTCSGSDYCDSGCPEYDTCECDPYADGCGDTCSGSDFCDSSCPEYDECECDPDSAACAGVAEVCDNGKDDDGDGDTDCADSDCSGDAACRTCDDSAACNYGAYAECDYESCECEGPDCGCDPDVDPDCAPAVDDCIVISVSGINADASFDSAVRAEIAKSDGDTQFVSKGATNDADGMASSLEGTLSAYYGNQNQNERILVVAHSLGAIATFNMRQEYGGTYPDTTFLLYDPPYNYPGSANPMSWFSGTLRAIKRAREGGIASSLTADWTGGLDNPKDPGEQANHEKFVTAGSSVLTGITSWVDGCVDPES